MDKKKHGVIITLPPHLSELPVRIIRGTGCKELVCSIEPQDNDDTVYKSDTQRKYAFVWRQNSYLKLTLDEIVHLEACGSYCTINMLEQKEMVISSRLAIVEKVLPDTDFIRIHRSHIVNLKHVTCLTGNTLSVGKETLPIGREYRDALLDRFIFLGVRRNRK
ncbi:MAG: LytTR family DNA-binding domain-containing protein [Rikenellaceae bacterium]|nr:LytTR family DNA-binding domain-containing protein [Rikenellaceae bacterium]